METIDRARAFDVDEALHMGLGFLESLLEGWVVGIDLLAKLRGEIVAKGVGNHEITIGQTLHEGAGSQAVRSVIREISLSCRKQAWNGGHKVVINPEATHGVMRRWINTHRPLIGIFARYVVIHIEQVAVSSFNRIKPQPFNRITEIKVHAQAHRANTVPGIATLLCRP